MSALASLQVDFSQVVLYQATLIFVVFIVGCFDTKVVITAEIDVVIRRAFGLIDIDVDVQIVIGCRFCLDHSLWRFLERQRLL